MYPLRKLVIPGSFALECGQTLEDVTIAYTTYGTFNPSKNNVIWVCHALTANSDVFDWWSGVFGENDLFNPRDYFIVCANILGSHYGSTGPLNYKHTDGQLTLEKFPLITTRDMAKAHRLLQEELKIESIHLLIGASLGGQQAQEFALLNGKNVENLVLIATNAFHSPFGIAFNASQRLAIEADPTYGESVDGGRSGLIAARSIAMLSYRSYSGYQQTQTEKDHSKLSDFRAATYQKYQGEKLANRFNAYSYVVLSKAMDAHHVGRGRESAVQALNKIRSRTLLIGITSDILFPPTEQKYLNQHISGSVYAEIDSPFGHDGFLVESEQLTRIIKDFLYNDFGQFKLTTFKQQTEKK